jgi:hypothetical protein
VIGVMCWASLVGGAVGLNSGAMVARARRGVGWDCAPSKSSGGRGLHPTRPGSNRLLDCACGFGKEIRDDLLRAPPPPFKPIRPKIAARDIEDFGANWGRENLFEILQIFSTPSI